MLATKGESRKWLQLTLLLTAVLVLIVQLPLITVPEYVDEDLRFWYWLHRFTNPALFEADPLVGYQFAEVDLGFAVLVFNKVSLLYGILYAFSSQFLSPFIFSKLLIFPLALISSYYLFRIGERIADTFTAFLLSITFTLIVALPYSSISLSSGLPRAFTLPLLLPMLYYMMVDNHWGIAVVLVMSLFYPPVFLTVSLTYGVKYTLESFQRRQLALTRKQIAILSVALLISIFLLLPAVLTGLNTVPSQETTVFSSPLFGDEGRYPLLKPQPLAANGGLLDSGMIGHYSLVFGLLLIPITLVRRRQFNRLPAPFWYLGLASLIGFGLSWLAILLTPSASLHLPSRYMRGTIFLTSLILFTINGPLAIQVGAKRLANNRGNLDGLLVVAGVGGLVMVHSSDVSRALTAVTGLLVVIMAVLLLAIRIRPRSRFRHDNVASTPKKLGRKSERAVPRFHSVLVTAIILFPLLIYLQRPNKLYRPESESAELVNFMKTLPQNALIAGYPCYLDDIPLYSQRTILFSCETESRDMELMRATLQAYFAETNEEVLTFCRQYNVDYMVGGPETFTETFRNQEHIIFEPLNSFLKQILAGRSTFAVGKIPENIKVFQNKSYFVFPCTADALVSAE